MLVTLVWGGCPDALTKVAALDADLRTIKEHQMGGRDKAPLQLSL